MAARADDSAASLETRNNDTNIVNVATATSETGADTGVFGRWTDGIAVVGAVMVVYWVVVKLFPFVYQSFWIHVVCRCIGPLVQLNQYGAWAVVTGCTDGIGKAYAEELAGMGLNIVLVSRDPQKLADQAEVMSQKFGILTRTITADFSQEDIYPRIAIQLDGLDIGTLVNNVGIGMDPQYFDRVQDKLQVLQAMINCNVSSVTMMTAMVLPAMLRKKRGAIINVSSAAGCRPMPLMALYSSTKAMVNNLTEALAAEYSDSGIIFQAVTPYLVATKMSNLAEPTGLVIPTPQVYVTQALRYVGIKTVTPAYFWHDLQHLVLSLMPAMFFRHTLTAFMSSAKKKRMMGVNSAQNRHRSNV